MLALIAMMTPMGTWADTWWNSISAPASIEYVSNPRFKTPAADVWRFRVVPSYSLTGTFGRDEIKANAAVRIERSTDELLSVNRQDPNGSLRWSHKTDSGEYGLTGTYTQSSLLLTELDQSGNVVPKDGTRTSKSVTGNWSSSITERSKLSAYGTYLDASSSTSGPSNGVDVGSGVNSASNFTTQAGGVNLNYALSERIEPFVGVAVNRFDSPSLQPPSRTRVTVSAGGNWMVSERLTVSAQAGVIKSLDTQTLRPQESIWVRYDAGNSNYSLNANHGGFTTGSQGGFSNRDSVTLTWGYSLDEKTKLNVNASWAQYGANEGVTSNGSGTTSSATTTRRGAGVSMTRSLDQFWHLQLSYQYTDRERNGGGAASTSGGASSSSLGAISSHLVNLTVSYDFPDF